MDSNSRKPIQFIDIKSLNLKCKNIHELASSLIDPEGRCKEKEENFVASKDISRLPAVIKSYDPTESEKQKIVFRELTPHFLAGARLQKNRKCWVLTDFFKLGTFYITTPLQLKFQPPKISPLEVHRVESTEFVLNTNLDFFDTEIETHIYCFQPCADTIYLLEHNLAEPWQSEYIESTQNVINRCLAP